LETNVAVVDEKSDIDRGILACKSVDIYVFKSKAELYRENIGIEAYRLVNITPYADEKLLKHR